MQCSCFADPAVRAEAMTGWQIEIRAFANNAAAVTAVMTRFGRDDGLEPSARPCVNML